MSQPLEASVALAIICSIDMPGASPDEPIWMVTGQLAEILTAEDKAEIIEHAKAVLKRRCMGIVKNQ